MIARILHVTTALSLCALAAFAQSATTTTPPVLNLSAPKLPAMFGAYGQYNQLGTPRFNGGVVAIYPIFQSAGVYGETLTDILPTRSVDPTTGRPFLGVNTSVRQGACKDLIDTWKFSALVCGDVGPTFSSATGAILQGGTATISVTLSTSATGLLVYRATSWLDIPFGARALEVSTPAGARWNLVPTLGFLFNLKKLPKTQQ